ncbi:MAG: hypothetical protein F6J87_23435 [Spirulina sp. SIO3F2]|nr:hypothetical protein [Spirulina sp. SIO3F2]
MNSVLMRFTVFLLLTGISLAITFPSDAHGDERHDYDETPIEQTAEPDQTVEPDPMMATEGMPHDATREPEIKEHEASPETAFKTASTFPQGLGETLFGLLFVVPVSLHLYQHKYHR